MIFTYPWSNDYQTKLVRKSKTCLNYNPVQNAMQPLINSFTQICFNRHIRKPKFVGAYVTRANSSNLTIELSIKIPLKFVAQKIMESTEERHFSSSMFLCKGRQHTAACYTNLQFELSRRIERNVYLGKLSDSPEESKR